MKEPAAIHRLQYFRRVAGGVLLLASLIASTVASQAAVRVQPTDLERFQARAAQIIRRVSEAGADTLAADTKAVTLSRGEFLEATVEDSIAVDSAGPVPHLDLKYRYLGAATTGDLVTLSIAIENSSGGLRFDPKRGLYEGLLGIGLDDSTQPGQMLQLQTPIRMTVSAGVDTIAPRDLVLDHTNLPFERVRMVAKSPGDSVSLHVRPSFNREGQKIWVAVERPQLVVTVTPSEINGFGLETATITVVPPLSTVPWPIVLQTDEGTLDSTNLMASSERPAVIHIRSQGRGLATIRASHPQLREGAVQVGFVSPTGFIIAAILGGLLGALITALTGERTKGASKKWLGAFVAGVVTGLIAALLYALGVNITGADIKVQFAEAATAAIAAVAGAVGPKILPGAKKG